MANPTLNKSAQRIAELAKLNESIFHAGDLANLWQIKDKNTLYTTLKRYAQSGLLHRIYKGLYALLPVEKLQKYELGIKIANRYSYVSTETILFAEGYISQKPNVITYLSSISKEVTVAPHRFRFRRLQAKFLFNQEGIEQQGTVFFARPERAIADMLYFNPNYNFDREPDWKKIKNLQQKLCYPLTPSRYDSSAIK